MCIYIYVYVYNVSILYMVPMIVGSLYGFSPFVRGGVCYVRWMTFTTISATVNIMVGRAVLSVDRGVCIWDNVRAPTRCP